MSNNYEWKENYSIGVEEIDYQHKRFLSFINQISKLEQTGTAVPEALDVVRELEKYLLFHTKSEEFMMEMYSYPGLEAQKKEHARIAEVVRVKVEELRKKSVSLHELLAYLLEWFDNHTTSMDRDFGEYIKQKRGGLTMEPGLL